MSLLFVENLRGKSVSFNHKAALSFLQNNFSVLELLKLFMSKKNILTHLDGLDSFHKHVFDSEWKYTVFFIKGCDVFYLQRYKTSIWYAASETSRTSP